MRLGLRVILLDLPSLDEGGGGARSLQRRSPTFYLNLKVRWPAKPREAPNTRSAEYALECVKVESLGQSGRPNCVAIV